MSSTLTRSLLRSVIALMTVAGLSVVPADAQDATLDDALEPPPADPTWKGAIADSFRLLMLEHVGRIAFQSKTRRELGGPFMRDYIRSAKIPDTWEDGDQWYVNYIGHPVHGGAAGFIWLDHEDGAHDPELGFSRRYWSSRGRAVAWAAVYSVQFEFGPLSDRYLITLVESWTGNRVIARWFERFSTRAGRCRTSRKGAPSGIGRDARGADPMLHSDSWHTRAGSSSR